MMPQSPQTPRFGVRIRVRVRVSIRVKVRVESAMSVFPSSLGSVGLGLVGGEPWLFSLDLG
eukprot:1369657-Amorphochlora_amoeboformis.AAC.1